MNMDKDTAIDNILRNFGELATVDRPQLEKIFNSGLERGLSIKQMYDGLRLVYGVNFHQPELFSSKEAAEMLNLSESDFLEEMQEQGIKTERPKGSVYYFPKGI